MAISKATLIALKDGGRVIQTARQGDELLGPLALLPGVWKNEGGLEGRGWNMMSRARMNSENRHFRLKLVTPTGIEPVFQP